MIGISGKSARYRGAMLALALCLCACGGPAPGPTASAERLPSVTFNPIVLLPSFTPALSSGTSSAAPYPAPATGTSTVAPYPPPATAGPTNTPQPYVPPPDTPTTTRTPRESATPTITLTPTPDPRILSVAAVPCTPAGEFMRCQDPVLGLTFEQPAEWGAITATLRESFSGTGFAYEYRFHEGLGPLAGGRSADFTEGRGAMPTDFMGGSSPEGMCAGLTASVCEVVQPKVALAFRFPEAEYLCDQTEMYFFKGPRTLIWIFLPDHPQINGFVFATGFPFSESAGNSHLELHRTILGRTSDGTYTRCEPEHQAEFNAAIDAYMDVLESGQVDAETLANVRRLRHLAESIATVP